MDLSKLRKRREELGMTVEQVGAGIDRTGGCISYWERGKKEPRIGVLNKLVESLGGTIEIKFPKIREK